MFVYFYFFGYSDYNGNLLCFFDNDCLTVDDLEKYLIFFSFYVREFLIILDCCFVDGNIVLKYFKDESYLVYKLFNLVNVEVLLYFFELLCSKLRKVSSDENCCVIDKSFILNIDLDIVVIDFSVVDGNVIYKVLVILFFIIR